MVAPMLNHDDKEGRQKFPVTAVISEGNGRPQSDRCCQSYACQPYATPEHRGRAHVQAVAGHRWRSIDPCTPQQHVQAVAGHRWRSIDPCTQRHLQAVVGHRWLGIDPCTRLCYGSGRPQAAYIIREYSIEDRCINTTTTNYHNAIEPQATRQEDHARGGFSRDPMRGKMLCSVRYEELRKSYPWFGSGRPRSQQEIETRA